jgi:hypothetical protein
MSDMLVIVPSRGRPSNIARLYRAWDDTDADADLWVCVDIDDPQLAGYREVNRGQHGVLMIDRPHGSIVPILNQAAKMAVDAGYRQIGFCGDDHRPVTVGWDKALAAALDELGTGIAYGNDLMQGERIPTAVFMTADIPAALGYMCPPCFTHLYLDDCWRAWADGIDRRRYLPDVIIEHLHPQAGGKAEWDDGYRRCNGGDMWERDTAAWHLYRSGELHHDLCKLKGLIDG